MPTKIGINGFGRMGRLALRAGWGRPDLQFVHINEVSGGPETAAHLLTFDSIHGRWGRRVESGEGSIAIDGTTVAFSDAATPGHAPWSAHHVDLVLECSGKFRTTEALDPYFAAGVKKVVVAALVKSGALNIVVGVNDHLYDPATHRLLTAASCTTNCLAPVVKVIHQAMGIRHGVITTIHDMTNTQVVVDAPLKDLRRARASSLSLIPTSTGSATAIALIYPELLGKLTGVAVRVPLLNASLTDCVFEVQRPTTVEEVNAAFKRAAEGPLKGILGYEERPLVSVDFKDDTRSAIIDALSTMVVDGTCVKVLAWYDNEIGYVNRLIELAQKVGASLSAPRISIRNYAIVTAVYWAFTLTDGALRMLVLLHFNQLGYTPVQLAFLFLLYEFFGIVTNLVGGWVASRTGLRFTLVLGLVLQVVALGLLALLNRDWTMAASVAYVMGCQALSGIAKDLTKMSAKSAVKVLVPKGDESGLFTWVAVLTGSKNALKGAGFFVGGLLLSALGFRGALLVMASGVFVVLVLVLTALPAAIGQAKKKAAFSGILSNSSGINRLSLARLALFAARDVWFVVSVPIFLSSVLGWSFTQVGGFMAFWVIAYGAVQSVSPLLLAKVTHGGAPGPVLASTLGIGLAAVTALIPIGLRLNFPPAATMLGGLVLFGIVFALNSSVHSYLVLAYSEADRVSLSVGFYYMANACGRLLGTLLSGVLYQQAGVSASLWGAVALAAAAGIGAMFLPPVTADAVSWAGAKGDD